MFKRLTVCVIAACALGQATLRAQPAPLTLPRAVQMALEKYPAVRASVEQVEAASAGIKLARTGYLPRADFLGQLNRATRNNVFGLLLPQPVIPSISGPVLGTNNFTNVWGSAAGLLVSWEPFDFGYRKATVESAESSERKAETSVSRTRFEVSVAAADAFLTLLAARQTVLAAQAGVDRIRVVSEAVDALVRASLRPGGDLDRLRAEGAVTAAQLVEAEQAVAVSRATLAQLLGIQPPDIAVEPGPLLKMPPESGMPAANPTDHPLVKEQRAAVEEVQSREKSLARAYFPHFNLQAATYARGTGARTDGTTAGGGAGMAPDTFNWGVGITVTFPAFDLPSIRARREIELHRERAETARYDQALQDLKGRMEKARAAVEGARRVAETTPVRVDAARSTRMQAIARYKAGLGTMVEVADAERLLTQAEIDDALASLNVWRSQLALAAASGDLAPFLAEAGR